ERLSLQGLRERPRPAAGRARHRASDHLRPLTRRDPDAVVGDSPPEPGPGVDAGGCPASLRRRVHTRVRRLGATQRAAVRGCEAYYREENPSWPDSLVETRARDITTTRREAITELRAASMANEGLDTLEGLERITVPVLFIHGDPETGSMVHPADLAALPDRLSSVRTVRIPGGGHSMHRNRVEEWVEIVKGFMRDLV